MSRFLNYRKVIHEIVEILYDHLNCDESDLEDCETLEELLEEMRL